MKKKSPIKNAAKELVTHVGKVAVRSLGPSLGAALPVWLGKTKDGSLYVDLRDSASFVVQLTDKHGIKISFNKVEISRDLEKVGKGPTKVATPKKATRRKRAKDLDLSDL